MSSQNKRSPDNQTSLSSSTPIYISDFEDNTIPTATDAAVGVSTATTVGSGDLHTIKSSTKKDTATDHVSEDISSEGDTLVDQHNNSQLDSTLQNGKRFVKLSQCIPLTRYFQETFGDFLVGWFKQVTLLHSDLIRQVSLYYHQYHIY